MNFYLVKNMSTIRCKRITKKEVMAFVEWAFNQTDDNMELYSNPKIAEMYMRDTGKYISPDTVRYNRERWLKVDGRIVRWTPELAARL